MQACEQTKGLSILAHGEQVHQKFLDLIQGRTEGWRLPKWFNAPIFMERLLDKNTTSWYHVYHDCGKPFCRTVGEDGKVHFPDHASVSAGIWRVHRGDPIIADLIQHDMDMHLMRPSDVQTYARKDLAPTLLLTALAEIHANAEMFGGIESTSFKIKFKNLERLGCAFYKELSNV